MISPGSQNTTAFEALKVYPVFTGVIEYLTCPEIYNMALAFCIVLSSKYRRRMYNLLADKFVNLQEVISELPKGSSVMFFGDLVDMNLSMIENPEAYSASVPSIESTGVSVNFRVQCSENDTLVDAIRSAPRANSPSDGAKDGWDNHHNIFRNFSEIQHAYNCKLKYYGHDADISITLVDGTSSISIRHENFLGFEPETLYPTYERNGRKYFPYAMFEGDHIKFNKCYLSRRPYKAFLTPPHADVMLFAYKYEILMLVRDTAGEESYIERVHPVFIKSFEAEDLTCFYSAEAQKKGGEKYYGQALREPNNFKDCNHVATITTKMELVEVWTDGSCLSNDNKSYSCGIGVFYAAEDPRNIGSRLPPGKYTNNRAELCAVLCALCTNSGLCNMTIYSDSKYAIACSTEYRQRWEQNGWKTYTGKLVEWQDIIKYIHMLIDSRFEKGGETVFVYVKGHATNFGNGEADALARSAAEDGTIHKEINFLHKKCRVPFG
ncbi:MAG: hypothetical protein Q9187_001234 [Circinaria calcarea]